MKDKQTVSSDEKRRKEMAARMWLHYFNRTLYEQGVITEQERNRMSMQIEEWKGPTM